MEHSCCYGCPFTLALDILGDEWILVIVKQMLIEGKETFKDFTERQSRLCAGIGGKVQGEAGRAGNCVIFAKVWLGFKKAGPLEWVMRRLTD